MKRERERERERELAQLLAERQGLDQRIDALRRKISDEKKEAEPPLALHSSAASAESEVATLQTRADTLMGRLQSEGNTAVAADITAFHTELYEQHTELMEQIKQQTAKVRDECREDTEAASKIQSDTQDAAAIYQVQMMLRESVLKTDSTFAFTHIIEDKQPSEASQASSSLVAESEHQPSFSPNMWQQQRNSNLHAGWDGGQYPQAEDGQVEFDQDPYVP